MAKNKEKNRTRTRTMGRAAAVGWEFSLAVIICLLLGYGLDAKLGSTPWFTLLGVIFGSSVGFRALYRTAKMLENSDEEGPKKG